MIGLIVALETEAKPFLDSCKIKKQTVIAGKYFYIGEFNGKNFVLAITNIGKVAAAHTTQLLIDKFSPEIIINFGSAGGVKEKVDTLSFVCIEKACQYDFDLSRLENCPVGFNQNYNEVFLNAETKGLEDLKNGVLASADKFTSTIQDVSLLSEMGCSVFDMEGAAISQVCHANDIPLYVIKGITDVFGSGNNAEQFVKNLSAICNGFPNILKKLIK